MKDDRQVIFVVDDDQNLCRETSAYLERYSFVAASFHNTHDLRQALRKSPCDLILLDIMLPGEDGITFFRNLEPPRPKVIIVSALDDETNKVMGLELGADDYMVKPFFLRELLARIRKVLSRPDLPAEDRICQSYHFSGWTMEPGARLLINPQGICHNLTGAEFRLLQKFLEHPNQVLEREELATIISPNQTVSERVLDMQVSRLRACLDENAKDQSLIRTSRGDGYLFSAQVKKEYADGLG